MSSGGLRLRRLWLGIGWTLIGLVVYLTLVPSPSGPPPFPAADKLEHALAYAVLMGWFAQLYRAPSQRWLSAGGLIALGVLLEYSQLLGGVRDFEYLDMLADAVGVLLGWLGVLTPLGRTLQILEARWLRTH